MAYGVWRMAYGHILRLNLISLKEEITELKKYIKQGMSILSYLAIFLTLIFKTSNNININYTNNIKNNDENSKF